MFIIRSIHSQVTNMVEIIKDAIKIIQVNNGDVFIDFGDEDRYCGGICSLCDNKECEKENIL